MAAPGVVAAYRKLARTYAADFPGYVRDILGQRLTPQQLEIDAASRKPPYAVLVPSGNKLGKSFLIGAEVNHFFDSSDAGVGQVLSATYRSLVTQAFMQVRRQRPLSIDLMPSAPVLGDQNSQHYVTGLSTRNPDAVQGAHAEHYLNVCDEATSIFPGVLDRIDTMDSGIPTHRRFLFYNPYLTTSALFGMEQAGGFHVVRLSALDHPNIEAELRGEPPPFPDAVRLSKVRTLIRKQCEPLGNGPNGDADAFEFPKGSGKWYKPKDPRFNPRVRGMWPAGGTLDVWGLEMIRQISQAGPAVQAEHPVQIGCDVARTGGDRTAIAVRKGVHLLHLETHDRWPTRYVGRHIAERLRQLCDHYQTALQPARRIPCLVDCTGGYGDTVTDHPGGYNFQPVVSSESAGDDKKYTNKRAELWYTARLAAEFDHLFTGRCQNPGLLPALYQELQAAKTLFDHKNRRTVTGKEAMTAALGRSPDVGDAVNLAWYPPVELAA